MRKNKNPIFCTAVCLLVSLFWIADYAQAQSKEVEVIEIRNYLVKSGQRDNYIEAFESKLIDTLNSHGNYVLGQYRVKGAEDNFVWIRGFDDMPTRKEALVSFFSSEYWETHKNIPGEYLVGYTNVYLLKPLAIPATDKKNVTGFDITWFARPKGVAVVDFYVANEMLDQLIDFVSTKYDSLMHAAGVNDITYWISETSPNNYPDLPVFQDKNLLVSIAFYKNEKEYEKMLKRVEASMDNDTKFTFGRIVTTKTTWMLYPTKKSFTAVASGERSR